MDYLDCGSWGYKTEEEIKELQETNESFVLEFPDDKIAEMTRFKFQNNEFIPIQEYNKETIISGVNALNSEINNFKEQLTSFINKSIQEFESNTGHTITKINTALINTNEQEGEIAFGDVSVNFIDIDIRKVL
jgi:hypothetical protein